MKKIKVLHVFGSTFCGGAEKRTVEIMRYIDKSKYQFDFCSLIEQKGDLDEEIEFLGGRVFYIKKKSLHFAKRFSKLLATEKFDVVHTHIYPFSGYIVYLASKHGVPKRIVQFRSTYENPNSFLKKIFKYSMNYMIRKYATDILAVCRGAMDVVWKNRQDSRCQVVYHGIDIKKFMIAFDSKKLKQSIGVGENDSIIIHVGNMSLVKNHIRIVKIFSQILLLKSNFFLVLVGRIDSEIEKNILQVAYSLNIRHKIIILGLRQDVSQLLRISQLFIFPSFYEGLPGAVLEASAAGIGVLASDIVGVKEIAEYLPNVHFLSLKENDSKWAELAIKITDEKYSMDLQKTPFDLHKNIDQLLQIYER